MKDTFKAPYSTYPDDRAFWRIRDGLGNLVARDFDEDEAKELARKLNEHASQAARIEELEARVKELEAALEEIQSAAEEAQGEWHLVSILYTPEKIAPYKEIENIAARILLETK